eukprot:15031856-Alexandrium_andersonii.AAC.1
MNRDVLVAQRSKNLQGRTGQLQGFTLEGFLLDYEEEGQPCPWTVGGHALPGPEGREGSSKGQQ